MAPKKKSVPCCVSCTLATSGRYKGQYLPCPNPIVASMGEPACDETACRTRVLRILGPDARKRLMGFVDLFQNGNAIGLARYDEVRTQIVPTLMKNYDDAETAKVMADFNNAVASDFNAANQMYQGVGEASSSAMSMLDAAARELAQNRRKVRESSTFNPADPAYSSQPIEEDDPFSGLSLEDDDKQTKEKQPEVKGSAVLPVVLPAVLEGPVEEVPKPVAPKGQEVGKAVAAIEAKGEVPKEKGVEGKEKAVKEVKEKKKVVQLRAMLGAELPGAPIPPEARPNTMVKGSEQPMAGVLAPGADVHHNAAFQQGVEAMDMD